MARSMDRGECCGSRSRAPPGVTLAAGLGRLGACLDLPVVVATLEHPDWPKSSLVVTSAASSSTSGVTSGETPRGIGLVPPASVNACLVDRRDEWLRAPSTSAPKLRTVRWQGLAGVSESACSLLQWVSTLPELLVLIGGLSKVSALPVILRMGWDPVPDKASPEGSGLRSLRRRTSARQVAGHSPRQPSRD